MAAMTPARARAVPSRACSATRSPHRPGLDARQAQPRPVRDRWNSAGCATRGRSAAARGRRVAKGRSGSARAPGGASGAVRAREMMSIEPRWEMVQRPARAICTAAHPDYRAREKGGSTPARRRADYTRSLDGVKAARSTRHPARCAIEPLFALNVEPRRSTLYREEGRREDAAEAEAALREEIARLEERHARIESAPGLEEEATSS